MATPQEKLAESLKLARINAFHSEIDFELLSSSL
jgi:hypothetical protein